MDTLETKNCGKKYESKKREKVRERESTCTKERQRRDGKQTGH